jgi:hypothetical protein
MTNNPNIEPVMINSQTKESIEVPNHTDKIDDLLRCVRDAGATDDNFGGEDWTLSDKVIDEAKAQLRNYISEEIKIIIGEDIPMKADLVHSHTDIINLQHRQLETARNRGHNV